MTRARTQQKIQHQSELYRIVFSSVYVKGAIALLLLAFLVQPVAPVFANEETAPAAESAASVPAEVVEEPEASVEVVGEEPVEELVEGAKEVADTAEVQNGEDTERSVSDPDESQDDQTADTILEYIDSGSDESTAEVQSGNDVEIEQPAQVLFDEHTYTDDSADETATTTEEESVTARDADSTIDSRGGTSSDGSAAESPQDASTTTEQTTSTADDHIGTTETVATSTHESESNVADESENDKDEITSTVAADVRSDTNAEEPVTIASISTSTTSSSTVASTELVQIRSSVFDDPSRHQFNKDDCVSMGDGSFFCSEAEDLPVYKEDGVFSVPDSDGDMEIMVRVNGEESFLTNNLTDDQAPYYDGLSKRIVWQSMQNDRYQIASYDFATKETSYLTDTTYNNMEPVAYGSMTLWQAWIVNNWEIMLYDGSTTTQLTTNAMNDIAPQVRNGYVIWQTQFADGWKIAMYDEKSKQVEYIGDADGSLAANPRLVLVYDSLDDNGDVRTVGFDLDARQTIPFTQIPSQLPDKLPEPQGTEETRALIQNKSNTKDMELVDITAPTGSSTPPIGTSTPSVSDLTLDLTATTTVTTASTTGMASDLVVPSLREKAEQTVSALLDAKLNATSTEHIEDVVIPPLATSTDAVIR